MQDDDDDDELFPSKPVKPPPAAAAATTTTTTIPNKDTTDAPLPPPPALKVIAYVTRSAKINHVSVQNLLRFFSTLLCHSSHYSYGNRMKLTPHMQKFMENLIKLTKCKYLFQNKRYC